VDTVIPTRNGRPPRLHLLHQMLDRPPHVEATSRA
jgi:hypothetical protein